MIPERLPPIYYPYICQGGADCAAPNGKHIFPHKHPQLPQVQPPDFTLTIEGRTAAMYYVTKRNA